MCANTQSAAIGSAKASFAIRYTGGARTSIHEARNALKLSWRYIEAFEAEAAKLFRATNGHRASPLLRQHPAFGRLGRHPSHRPPPPRARQRHRQAVGTRPTIAPIAGTRWAAYNAVTEYLRPHRSNPGSSHRHRRQRQPAPCAASPPPAAPNR